MTELSSRTKNLQTKIETVYEEQLVTGPFKYEAELNVPKICMHQMLYIKQSVAATSLRGKIHVEHQSFISKMHQSFGYPPPPQKKKEDPN